MVGTITQDFIESPGGDLSGELGGSATYFALAARHFGAVRVVGTVGTDRAMDVRRVLDFADLSLVTVRDTPTYTWRARRATPDSDAVTLDRFDGASKGYRPALGTIESWPHSIFLASTDPDVQLAVAEQADRAMILGGDTMDIFIQRQRAAVLRMVKQLRLLTVTQTELELLTQTRGVAAGAMRLLTENSALAAVFIKRGPAGVVMWTRERNLRLPAYPVVAVDPTGAGDVFAGALMGRLAELQTLAQSALEDAARWGVVAAAYAVEAVGLNGIAAATRADMEARLARYRRLEMHPREAGDPGQQ